MRLKRTTPKDEELGDTIPVDDHWVVFIQLPPDNPKTSLAVHLNQLGFPTRGFGLVVNYLDDDAEMGRFESFVYAALDTLHISRASLQSCHLIDTFPPEGDFQKIALIYIDSELSRERISEWLDTRDVLFKRGTKKISWFLKTTIIDEQRIPESLGVLKSYKSSYKSFRPPYSSLSAAGRSVINKLRGSGLEDKIIQNSALAGFGFRYIRGGTMGLGELEMIQGMERTFVPTDAEAPPYIWQELPVADEQDEQPLLAPNLLASPPPSLPPSPRLIPVHQLATVESIATLSRGPTPEPLTEVRQDQVETLGVEDEEDVEEEAEVEGLLAQ